MTILADSDVGAEPQVAPNMAAQGRRPGLVVAGLVGKKLARSGGLWGYVYGGYALTSLYGYVSAYKTQAARDNLAHSFGSNLGINALIGPAHVINTVPGFLAWRTLGVISLVGAIWGLLTATRVMRGDEEAGRWELLLAGQTTRQRAAVQALTGLGVGLISLFGVTAVLTVLTGHLDKAHIGTGPTLFFALALVCATALFMAVGALASQLANTRRRASWIAASVFGASYVLRMVADSQPSLHWLVWLSPLGWVEELRPLTGSSILPLVPVLSTMVVLVAGTVLLAGRRDLGAATLADRDHAPARTRLLGGPTGLAVRLTRAVSLGWWAGTAAFALLIGMVAVSATQAIGTSNQVTKFLGDLGLHGSLVKTYLGLTFLMVALMVVFTSAGQASSIRAEEADGFLDNLLFRPVSRWSWLMGRIGVGCAVLVVSGMAAGVFAWLGSASQHAGISIGELAGAGANMIPPALFVLGLGTLTFGLAPRRTSTVVYGYVVWSFLLEFIGGVVHLSHWVMDSSVLFHMAPAPATSPDWAANAVMVGLAAVMVVAGGAAFARRDLQNA